MVRLADLQTDFQYAGTAGVVMGSLIAKDRVRNIYRMRLHQRGATLSILSLKAQMGATVFATIDLFQFHVAGDQQDFPGGPLNETSAPLYKIRSDDATALYAFADQATVDVFVQYEDAMD